MSLSNVRGRSCALVRRNEGGALILRQARSTPRFVNQVRISYFYGGNSCASGRRNTKGRIVKRLALAQRIYQLEALRSFFNTFTSTRPPLAGLALVCSPATEALPRFVT